MLNEISLSVPKRPLLYDAAYTRDLSRQLERNRMCSGTWPGSGARAGWGEKRRYGSKASSFRFESWKSSRDLFHHCMHRLNTTTLYTENCKFLCYMVFLTLKQVL